MAKRSGGTDGEEYTHTDSEKKISTDYLEMLKYGVSVYHLHLP